MHILIIEDNHTTANTLTQGLGEQYYVTSLARDGAEGVYMANQQDYDLIIVDVMLPKLDGWEVVKQIRYFNETVPILFLTACDAVDERVKGFNCGADDYLLKPFAFSELLVRIKALLKRRQTILQDKINIADLTIDTAKHKVYRGKKRSMLK